MHKLDPIERLPDGSLFRLTPGQLRSMRGLTKRCCNFSGGDCLLLDGACPQYISRSLLCRWFRRAVRPQQPKLEQAILSPKKLRRCEVCGTGILAIAAKLVGAAEVAGTDIDPQAVEAAGDNALMNHVEAKFYLPDDMPEGTYDIVVANILANPLKLLAPALLGRVKQGGALVLSGVLAKQAEEVIAAYQAIDPAVKLSVWRQEEDWVCIAGRRA